ncbi:MAG: hypothetical protein GHCLOJNM_01990 [bacterium]|nr:hypothetical protein [bacterium]
MGHSWRRYDKWALAALLLIGFLIRVRGIEIDLIDHHCWREGTEAMMARHFFRHGITVQYPHINGYSARPSVFVNEFPLYPATLALAYREFGAENIVLGRLISIACSLATAALCYWLLRRHFNNSAPFWGALLFVLSPLGSYVGRCLLRHPMAFFLMTLAFCLWLLWLERPTWRLWVGVWICCALAVLTNFANAYVGVPMLAALLFHRGVKGLSDRRVWGLAGAIFLPTALWIYHAMAFGAWFLTGQDGAKQRDFGRFLRLEWWNSEFFSSLADHLYRMVFTPMGCLLAALGLLLYWRSPLAWIVRIWAVSVFAYLAFDHYVVYIVVHDYYFLHALFPGCLAAGIGCGALVDLSRRLSKRYPNVCALGASVLLLPLVFWSWRVWDAPLKESFLVTEPGWIQNWVPAGKAIQAKTERDAVLVVDREIDALIYLCDRPGWVTNWRTLDEATIRSLIEAGADYLLITKYTMGENGRFTGYLFDDPKEGSPAAPWVRAHCAVIEDASTFQIVDLTPDRPAQVESAAPPGGEDG